MRRLLLARRVSSGALRWVITLAITLVASNVTMPARAHPAQFGSIHAREIETGRFVVGFEYSGDESSPRGASITWPAGCEVEGRVDRVDRPFGEAQRMRVRCDGDAALRAARVEALPVGVEIAIRVERADGSSDDALLDAGSPTFVLSRPAADPVRELGRYVALGAEHIAGGLDHLLFVAVLLLAHRRRALRGGGEGERPLGRAELARLVGTLTAFTAGHSVTLALSVLDVVSLPSAPVETCIALSVLLVAVEVARVERGGPARTLLFQRPWLLASIFGLAHGLGFADALREAGLGDRSVGVALAGFNLGVELGQIAFVLALLVALALARRTKVEAEMPLALTYVAGALAAAWSIERALGLGG